MEFTTSETAPDTLPSSRAKVRSTQRLRYEAEVRAFRRKHGTLESVRQNLGLSRRKICQLLLVDPSAWTRWTKQDEEQAPPHVYRALDWYINRAPEQIELDKRIAALEMRLKEQTHWRVRIRIAVSFLLGCTVTLLALYAAR